MIDLIINSNKVDIVGIVDSELSLNHEVYGEQFYSFMVKIKRLSGEFDNIFCLISDRTVDISSIKLGMVVSISGQYRSYNNFANSGNKLILAVFVKSINFLNYLVYNDENQLRDNTELKPETSESEIKYVNSVYLNGFICKAPIYRTTPLGRDIADILLAVNRHYNKSDYIPCIAWGRNAKFAGNLTVGTNISICGRAQSRQYKKYITEEEVVFKTAYEISISKLEIIESK